MIYPNFLGPSNLNHTPFLDQERTVNLILEKAEAAGSSAAWSMYLSPGVTLLSTDTGFPGRANYFEPSTQRQFVVQGTRFNEVSILGTITNRGTVASDGNAATIVSNGPTGGQLLIVSGGNAYSFTLSTNTFASIALLAGIATVGASLDGYGLVSDVTSGRTYFSALNDFTSWDLTDYFAKSKSSDPLVTMRVANGNIYLFGTATTEVWYNAGEFPVPFVFHPSGLIQYGCVAQYSPEIVGKELRWLSSTVNGQGSVVKTSGFGIEIVSSMAMQTQIGGYSVISDAIGDAYEMLGHTFHLLTFPTANVTWCADIDLPKQLAWTERLTWIAEDAHYVAWRPLYHALAFNEHRMLDRSTGAIYRLDPTVYTDVPDTLGTARPLRWLRQAPALVNENKRVFYPAFEVDFEVGLGLTTGQGSDPQVMMQFSNDNGKTWSSEAWRSAGKRGEYGHRVVWNRCGSGRRRVFRIAGTDPIPWKLVNAYLPDLEKANPDLGARAA
jgi:hypothetical protein